MNDWKSICIWKGVRGKIRTNFSLSQHKFVVRFFFNCYNLKNLTKKFQSNIHEHIKYKLMTVTTRKDNFQILSKSPGNYGGTLTVISLGKLLGLLNIQNSLSISYWSRDYCMVLSCIVTLKLFTLKTQFLVILYFSELNTITIPSLFSLTNTAFTNPLSLEGLWHYQ